MFRQAISICLGKNRIFKSLGKPGMGPMPSGKPHDSSRT